MIFRIVTKHGMTIDMTVNADFNFLNTCVNVRMNGAFVNETLHIPYDSISFFGYGDPAHMPQGNAPTVGTKQ